jgi:hypothetical protein
MVSNCQPDAYKIIWTVAFLLCLVDVYGPNRSAGSESYGPDSTRLKGAVDYFEYNIAPSEPSRVPDPLRQGEFFSPQSVSALAISPDGRQLAVTTMAFRHDHNFWLLAEDSRILWGDIWSLGLLGRSPFSPTGSFCGGASLLALHGPKPDTCHV